MFYSIHENALLRMQFKKADDEGYTFERDDFSKESQGAKDEESVSRSH